MKKKRRKTGFLGVYISQARKDKLDAFCKSNNLSVTNWLERLIDALPEQVKGQDDEDSKD